MIRTILLPLLATAAALPALAQDAGEPGRRPPEFQIVGSVNKPTMLPANVAGLRVPAGYQVTIAARDLGNARMIAAAPDGTVYVTRRDEADVLMLQDSDGDGVFDSRRVVASRPGMHGIALDGRTAYLITVNEIFSTPIATDGSFGALTTIVDDLPDSGQHPNRVLAVGPDDMLYVSVGSTCNACDESNPENATILRLSKDGKQRSIFASGLRNTIGYDWNPRTGQLWGLDQGIDWLGDENQPEELNRIVDGGRYGWPYIWGAGMRNPQDVPPNGIAMEEWDRMSQRMVAGYTAHAAAMQLKFNRGAGFAADAQGDGFATFRGSWNRSEPSGYEVVRVRFDAAGNPTAMEPFLTGFLTTAPGGEAGWTGRPTGLDFAPDGSMLVTDSEHGVLYRVRYTGPNRATGTLAQIAEAPRVPAPGPIALARPETAASGRLTVTSSAFRNGGPLPRRFSHYYDNASPPLNWSAGPANTASFAIIADDPDAKVKPTTHWVAYNVPGTVRMLPEGVPTAPQLAEPRLARQGVTTPGYTGWYGMQPPVGDPAHRYHFQVFALDARLDLLPGATREQLLAAMQGHVLAKGEIVGTYGQATPPTK